MCAILDASVVSQVFGTKCPPAGTAFFNWIAHRHGRLVFGGRTLDRELSHNRHFRKWVRQAILSGKARRLNDDQVDLVAEELKRSGRCRSNDAHVIAVARISGARLLYSNDKRLNKDFVDPQLVPVPCGQVYTTNDSTDYLPVHQALLDRRDLCPSTRTP